MQIGKDRRRLREVHEDMSRYLADECYCPGEIYGPDGFFFRVYHDEDECAVVEQTERMTVLVTKEDMPQAIIFWHDEPDEPGHIIDAQRVDATENNVGILVTIARGGEPDGRKIDEFDPGSLKRSLEKVMSIADAVIID